ncbi:unnamed protein product [Notodromas monacha]|uniref:Oligopeptide transporter 1 n=1 Tax=Notodromas monacha TaxID=399045 RepID=A0A7R9BC83_9CRUS|nr:unnamed protein product [Notodromas monacha]CAG0912208.1 unnamed protein product [Notodromas monacha]
MTKTRGDMETLKKRGTPYGSMTVNMDANDDEREKILPRRGKIPYPKSVFFIFGNEFCERFSFYGMKTILTIYLHQELKYSESSATVMYHVFNLFCYFTPLFGAILADSYWGKFKTITYISILYAIGNIIMAFGAVPIDGLPQIAITIIGLAVIAAGTGGIKPCVSAFGGDQFVLPDQERELQQFFSVFYFSINAGSLISTTLTPILREDVHCFGEQSCYSLAFGVPAVLMVVALVLFVLGKSMYTIREPEGNMVVEVSKCIGHAVSRKIKSSEPKKEHWLDYADDRFSKDLISDIKAVMKVLTLYIPLPIFWTLFDQQGSRWTLQATRMDGRLSDSFTLKPDQMQVVNPLLILGLIPLFESVLYPLFHKIGVLKRPLQKMVVGMILAGAAFAVSGFVELELRKGYPVSIDSGESRLVFMNTLDCDVGIEAMKSSDLKLALMANDVQNFNLKGEFPYSLDLKVKGDKCSAPVDFTKSVIVKEPKEAFSVIVTDTTLLLSEPQSYEKPSSGLPFVRVVYSVEQTLVDENNATVILKGPKKYEHLLNTTEATTAYEEETEPGKQVFSADVFNGGTVQNREHYLSTSKYQVYVDINGNLTGPFSKKMEFLLGGVYEVSLFQKNETHFEADGFVVTEPNNVHMLWLIPQYLIITTAEILFSPTGYEFSFTQSPTSMKAVIQSGWLMSIAVGNLIVVIVAEAKFFPEQYMEFFFFAGLIGVFAGLFSVMAYFYKYQDFSSPDDVVDPKKRNSISSVNSKSQGVENQAFDQSDSKF